MNPYLVRFSLTTSASQLSLGRGTSNLIEHKLKKFVTREIAIGHQGALEPVPPAFGLHAATPKDDWDRQIAYDAPAVVEPQLVE